MDKQEAIREGIALRLHTRDRTWLKMLDETNPRNCMWEELPFNLKLEYRDEATLLQKYEDAQGVVIKVDRELPDWLMEGQEAFTKEQMIDRFRQAGYEAVELLIKKVEDDSSSKTD